MWKQRISRTRLPPSERLVPVPPLEERADSSYQGAWNDYLLSMIRALFSTFRESSPDKDPLFSLVVSPLPCPKAEGTETQFESTE